MTTTLRYSKFTDPAGATLVDALAEQARIRPDATWLTFIGGETLSFGAAHRDALRVASFLASHGVRHGDFVALVAGGHADFVRAWLGLQCLGAVAVILNTELRGAFLRHPLEDSGTRLVIVDGALVGAVEEAIGPNPTLERVLNIGEAAPAPASLSRIDWAGWREAAVGDHPPPRPQDIACVMYTSGTTGPSKGVLMPHAHCALYAIGAVGALEIGDDDRYYVVLPLHHANGLLMQLGAALVAGIPAIVRARFSAAAWLSDIREHAATLTNCLGTLAAFICAQPPSPQDRSHRLRAIGNAPAIPSLHAALRERFGIADIISGYGMTEANMPVWGRLRQDSGDAAGWTTPHFDLVIADPDTDRELPAGQVGEILVRPKVPFGFMMGYHRRHEQTVDTWRNLWFHSGDAGVIDEHGRVRFVDRIKDCIRRRGENIAPSEIEAVMATLPGVAGVAAYAVPSPISGGEDEVMLAIVCPAGQLPDLRALGDAAESLLPRFARPRYLRQVDALPVTATGKVQRAELRRLGTAGAFDRGEPARREKAA